MDAWRTFLMGSRAMRALLEQELTRERGLSMAAYEVLLRLWETPDHRLRMLDLARSTQLSRNGLSQLVGRMEAAGLVERHAAPDDGRGTVCALTARGVRAFRRAAVVHVRGIQEHFASRFTDEEARQLAALLRRLLEVPAGAAATCTVEPGGCGGEVAPEGRGEDLEGHGRERAARAEVVP